MGIIRHAVVFALRSAADALAPPVVRLHVPRPAHLDYPRQVAEVMAAQLRNEHGYLRSLTIAALEVYQRAGRT